jgi:hypothetical protein
MGKELPRFLIILYIYVGDKRTSSNMPYPQLYRESTAKTFYVIVQKDSRENFENLQKIAAVPLTTCEVSYQLIYR